MGLFRTFTHSMRRICKLTSKYTERRSKQVARRRQRVSKKIILIIVEGDTEEKYFKSFKSDEYSIQVSNNHGGDKNEIISRANKIISDDKENDISEVWLVFDRDEDLSRPNDKSKYDDAFSQAEKNGWKIAHSNDSFELWILLHFEHVTSPLTRDQLNEKVRDHLANYEKGKTDVYNQTLDLQETAIMNAEKLEKNGTDCPSTNVHKLVQRLLDIR